MLCHVLLYYKVIFIYDLVVFLTGFYYLFFYVLRRLVKTVWNGLVKCNHKVKCCFDSFRVTLFMVGM